MYGLLKYTIKIFIVFIVVSPLNAFGQDQWPYREQLHKEIKFWKDIFARYDDDHYVLHDPGDLGVIYKVLTFDPLTSDSKRERQIALEKYEITKLLLLLAKKTLENEELTLSEKHLAQLFGEPLNPQKLKICAYRVRAQQGISNRFNEGLQRSFAYLPTIKKIFKENGLPESLSYLPHVESSFNPLARSSAGAVGMWQFVRKTAQIFMKVNSVIDERYDPITSSQAACSLLKINYRETGDWGLAITAYNHGLTGMKEGAKKYGRNYIEVRKKYHSPSFQFASKNFYPEFLAAVEIMENLEKYFPGVNASSTLKMIRYKLKKPVVLPLLAKNCGIDTARLKELNPGYTYNVWKGKLPVPSGSHINLPLKTDIALVNQYIEAPHTDAEETIKAAPPEEVRTRRASARQKKTPENKKKEKILAEVADNQTAKQQVMAEKGSPKKGESKPTRSANTNLSQESLKAELLPVLAVENQAITVFGNETLGHYAQWLKVSSQELSNKNKFSSGQKLRQKQKIHLDFSKVSAEEFQQSRISYHLSLVELMLREHNLDHLIDYTLRHGESLYTLAHGQFKIPPSLVLYFNARQDLNNLHAGSIIRIPVSKQP
ncbi:MAG: transglycosylase SLT domain-containing protein [Pseudomonadota bacterium]